MPTRISIDIAKASVKKKKMTPSEEYVSELCKKSFLPFWSFPSPLRKKQKELCDVLVVCGNIIIIISVKDISISNHTDESVKYDRWVKKAIYDSVDQIYGAERYLKTVNEIILNNGKSRIKLPEFKKRSIFRIAIAFGSLDNYPLPTGDFGNGFVSVFDEKSTSIILNELDTITDFTDYLIAKEKFTFDKTIIIPEEVDFLAFYLQTGLEFDFSPNTIVTETGLWNEYLKTPEYRKWRHDIRGSYIWDNMINQINNFHINDETPEKRRFEIEEAIRYVNLEPRKNRIELGAILENAIKNRVSARMLRPMEGCKHTYVMIPLNDKNWKEKDSELTLRCIVARLENPNTETIIGISIGSNIKGESCFDVCFLEIPEMDTEFIQHAKDIQEKYGYFKRTVESNSKDFR